MRVCVFKGFWGVADTEKYPKAIFAFGDNNIGQGIGGQAIIRNCPNAMGIPTKKLPTLSLDAFYTDAEYDDNVKRIAAAVTAILRKLKSGDYDMLILPNDGLGTGLAKLPEKAPRTYAYLQGAVASMASAVRVLG